MSNDNIVDLTLIRSRREALATVPIAHGMKIAKQLTAQLDMLTSAAQAGTASLGQLILFCHFAEWGAEIFDAHVEAAREAAKAQLSDDLYHEATALRSAAARLRCLVDSQAARSAVAAAREAMQRASAVNNAVFAALRAAEHIVYKPLHCSVLESIYMLDATARDPVLQALGWPNPQTP